MIATLLVLHAAGIVGVLALGDRRAAFAVAALPPGVTALWGVARLGEATPATASVSWVSGLDLELAFAVGPLASVLTIVVSGIGVLVFTYAAGYFTSTSGTARFAATLLGFSAAMVGLVWADSIWTLFLFWELTSITSFLLVGHKTTDATARLAARRALLITVTGGLALLAGFVIIADEAGTARLSEMGPVEGVAGGVAAVLVLVGAATKSAQVPFHIWLPGAMAAPTPVSAYLHSATMVKAGVVLVALSHPILAGAAPWKPVGVTLGLITMVWGAIGALRHTDGKLILAWGTVSQLGLMIAMLAVGTGKAVFAAVALLVAHAVFKAALFMVVGEIDVRAGTRDITQLSGLRRRMPVAAAVGAASAASMAGVPPLLGFPAKEAAVEAAIGLSGAELWLVTAGVVGGSVLTVAYTTRLILGLFGDVPGMPDTEVSASLRAMTAPIGTLGAASLAGYVALGWVTGIVRDAAVQLEPSSDVYSLLRWPGLTTAFMISVGIVLAGLVLGLLLARRATTAPPPTGARRADGLIDTVLDAAHWVTGRVQHGSLPVYLLTMAGVAALVTVPFFTEIEPDAIRLWDNAAQAGLAVIVVAAAVGSVRVDSRLGAALGLGAVGLGVAGLFVAHGAPDLALTQLLVETIVVVGFVMGLGHLTRRFPVAGVAWRSVRLAVAGLVGSAVTVALLASASSPVGTPPVERLIEEGADEGGGNNTVNVILTDIRALDTLGEIVVLIVVAVGILALARPVVAPALEDRQ